MASNEYDLFDFMRWLERHADAICSPNYEAVKTLGLKLMCLKVLLSCEGKWQIEDADLKIFLTRIRTVYRAADLDLRRLWTDLKGLFPDLDLNDSEFSMRVDLVTQIKMDDILSGVVESIQLLTPDIKEVYAILSEPSIRSICYFDNEDSQETLGFVEGIINYLLGDEHELNAAFELKKIQQLLRMLREFILFTAKKCGKLGKLKDLLLHAEFVIDKLLCLLYRFYDVDEMEMEEQLSFEMGKINPVHPEMGKIYVQALDASKSEVDKFDWSYLYSFLDHVLMYSSLSSNKSQMTFLYAELQFLSTFLDESPAQDQMFNLSWERMTDLIIGIIGAVIYNDESRDEVREVIMTVYDLQHIFMLKREDARKADYFCPLTPWRFLGPDVWRELDSHLVGMLEFEDQLRCLETHMDLTSPLKDEVQILRLKASFLSVFLYCRGKWHTEDGNLKALLTRIQAVFQTVYRNSDLRKLWAGFIQIETTGCGGMPMNMEHTLASMQKRLQLLNPDVQEVYAILSKSSRFISDTTDEAVIESLNILIENNEDLLRFHVQLVSPLKEELEAVEKCLKSLRDFLCFTAKRCSKLGKLKDLLILAESLVDNVSCLLFLCAVSEKPNDQMVKEMKVQLLSLLQKFSPVQPDVREIYFKALKASKSAQRNSTLVDELDWGFLDSFQDYILVLSGTEVWSATPIKDQILLLHQDLPFLLAYFAMDLSFEEHTQNDHLIFKDLLKRTSDAINDTRYVIGSLHYDNHNIYQKFSDFLARKFYDFYYPRSFRSNFPRTYGHGFIGYLLGDLNEILNTSADLVAPLKHQIEIVREELLSVRDEFGNIAKQAEQSEELQSQWTGFLGTAYHIEYIVDSFMAGHGPVSCHKLGLFNALEEIKATKTELKDIKSKAKDDKSELKPSFLSSQLTIHANSSTVNAGLHSKQRPTKEKYNSELVLFPKAAEDLMEQLTYGSEKLNFLSIVGMPGIGKTTLANSVFDSLVTRRFHVKARCCVSQVYHKRILLHEILQQVTTEGSHYETDDFDEKLYHSLKGRRYLILIDDIWDIQAWKEIKISFPDDKNGSRIMFTSRFDNIASQAGPEYINYHLSPLSAEMSWDMLERKIFGSGSCPTDLVELGREIAANCKGLPLTVDLIAGILQGKETREWKKVAESMMEYIFDDPQERCQKVLELSYLNLPEEFRPCFLYFAAFPEDTEIPTRHLILLWVAEGFVKLQKDDRRCLEDAAEDILNNLIGRSLVLVSKTKRMGGVKATRIHDLLHNFSIAQSKQERFLLKIDASTFSCDDCLQRGQYRLCIGRGNWCKFLESNHSATLTRSLINFYSLDLDPVSWNFSYSKLLRVVYIPHVLDAYYPAIFTLVHLRFLAIRCSAYQNLSEIHKLRNLETFINMNFSHYFADSLFLDDICNIKRLRHFNAGNYVYLECRKQELLEKSFQFVNLRILYHVKVRYADIEKIFKTMPNLVKLKVEFYNPDEGCYPSLKLGLLKKLESLKVTHYPDYPEDYPCKITNLPPYLKTLVLSGLNLPWTDIPEIGNLENLEVLKLKDGAFVGPIWDMNDGQFPKLKYLSLESLDLKEWNVTEDHFSCLEQLCVQCCEELMKLPLCLAEVETLQKIKLVGCCSSVERSVKIIKEEQKAIGNYEFVVKTEDTDSDYDEERSYFGLEDDENDEEEFESDEEEGTSI